MKPLKILFLFFVIVLLTLGFVFYSNAKSALSYPSHWSYNGENDPSHWGDLNSEFLTCKTGYYQSPINMVQTQISNLSNIEFNYKNTPLKISNNGHTIEVRYEPGSFIKIDGKRYELIQFHFHAPSEHTVDGKHYPLEAHLVHKSEDGKLAVVGVFMKEGNSNDFLETVWTHMPTQEGEKVVPGVIMNASVLPPDDKSYYNYIGSLTTPPCSEGVSWNVMKTPLEVSPEQIAKFTSIYSGNSRPIQPLNRRIVKVNR